MESPAVRECPRPARRGYSECFPSPAEVQEAPRAPCLIVRFYPAGLFSFGGSLYSCAAAGRPSLLAMTGRVRDVPRLSRKASATPAAVTLDALHNNTFSGFPAVSGWRGWLAQGAALPRGSTIRGACGTGLVRRNAESTGARIGRSRRIRPIFVRSGKTRYEMPTRQLRLAPRCLFGIW